MATVVKLPDLLIELAEPYAIAGHRSVPEQIEFWMRLGKTAEENPELPTHFIKNTLLAIAEADDCQLNTYSH